MSKQAYDEVIFDIDDGETPEEVLEETERLSRSRSARSSMSAVVPTLTVVGILLATWWLLAATKIWPPYLLPSPRAVASTAWQQIASGELLRAAAISLRRAAVGFSIAIALGTILGASLTASNFLGRGLGSITLGMQSLPSICWLPLAFLWFGLSEATILFVVIMGALPSVALGLRSGIENLPLQYERAGRNLGATGVRLYRYVIIPAALPAFLTGVEQGWAFAWRSLMAAEIIFFGLGLGQTLETGRQLSDLSLVLTAIVSIIAIGVLVDKAVFGLARKAVRRRWGLSGA